MKTSVVVFPFDLFGSGGTAGGAELLCDALKELIDDNKREKKPTRARAYADRLRLREFAFESQADYGNWRNDGRKAARRVFSGGDFLLWIAGNHLGVLPVLDALAKKHSDTLVIQFDAHLDVYNLSDCTEKLSHGNYLMHCAGSLPALVNVGNRELLLPPDQVGNFFQATFPQDQIACEPERVLKSLRKLARAAPRVFLDLDCDVFDAAFFPAVAQPQPFGISPSFFLRAVDAVWSEKVCGLAISEFLPARDERDRSLATLMWLLEFLLLRLYE